MTGQRQRQSVTLGARGATHGRPGKCQARDTAGPRGFSGGKLGLRPGGPCECSVVTFLSSRSPPDQPGPAGAVSLSLSLRTGGKSKKSIELQDCSHHRKLVDWNQSGLIVVIKIIAQDNNNNNHHGSDRERYYLICPLSWT